jgi:uncharacterized protein DUF3303
VVAGPPVDKPRSGAGHGRCLPERVDSAMMLPRADTTEERLRYMVIETFVSGPRPVYARAAERGRMLPAGLAYVESWVDERRLDRCFQLMETEDPTLFDEWIANWRDLVEFEVVPVISSAETAARMGA